MPFAFWGTRKPGLSEKKEEQRDRDERPSHNRRNKKEAIIPCSLDAFTLHANEVQSLPRLHYSTTVTEKHVEQATVWTAKRSLEFV
jgi:hypothetical protein